jgi:hypothetical protein
MEFLNSSKIIEHQNMKYLLYIFVLLLVSSPVFSDDIIVDEEQNSNSQNYDDNDISTPYAGTWFFCILPKIGYTSNNDYSIIAGLTLTSFYRPYAYGMWPQVSHFIDIEYKYEFNNKNSIVRIDYSYFPEYFAQVLGFGLISSYNINNSDIGIAPKISVGIWFFAQLDYRYNIIINNIGNSYHEITVYIRPFILPFFIKEVKNKN